ncbi:hypothetical protein ACQEVF_32550 [Nonomuraea polychroma]|uniref:hypothetical protein n=1 Tax=Nonomuraea polychroma TaxID=46176 RepID=UPI003D901DD4
MPVESLVTGEVLAALCPGCDTQLSAEFPGCPHDNAIDITNLRELPGRQICNDCGTTGWYGSSPRAVVTLSESVPPEQLERFKARLAEPYKLMYLPHAADPAAPARSEIDHSIPPEWL